jgi:hypothetical protein
VPGKGASLVRSGWVAALLFLLPRIASLLSPTLWLEDDDYLDLGWELSLGRAPYVDVPIPHHCLLELVLAALFRLAGPSLLLPELLNGAALWGTAILLHRLLRRAGRPGTGLLAGLVFSLTPILFRYHLWEREVFLILCFSAVLLLLAAPQARTRTFLAAGALLGLAVVLKLTALVFVGAVVAHLLLDRKLGAALLVLAVALGLAGVAFALVVGAYGQSFIHQVLLFHLLKGLGEELGMRLARFYLCASPLVVPGLVGLVLLWRELPGLGRAVTLWCAAYLGFYLFLSPTFWPHNCLELLPPLALGSAASLVFAVRVVGALPVRSRPLLQGAAAAVVLLALCAVGFRYWRVITPAHLLRSRVEVREVAGALARCTDPHERVLARGVFPVAAARPNLLPYWEVRSLMPLARRVWAERGLRALLEGGRKVAFLKQARSLSEELQRELERLLARQQVPALVVDPSPQFSPLAPSPALLSRHGLTRVLATTHYEVWARPERCRPR